MRVAYLIKHVIVIMQENRSFDHYFGTYPGADGFPRKPNGQIDVCVPNPAKDACDRPYHDTNDLNAGGPHGALNAGHAHADVLSLTASAHGRALLVDCGTYQYVGPERNAFRAAGAHNVVLVDGEGSAVPAADFSDELIGTAFRFLLSRGGAGGFSG